mmetsp:Transcript_20919/g.33504  ORF Transcript_20919/g.33504 Transcript_20919/m.33504 type:complete len:265 (-) Transcript_20919:612-1406(-)
MPQLIHSRRVFVVTVGVIRIIQNKADDIRVIVLVNMVESSSQAEANLVQHPHCRLQQRVSLFQVASVVSVVIITTITQLSNVNSDRSRVVHSHTPLDGSLDPMEISLKFFRRSFPFRDDIKFPHRRGRAQFFILVQRANGSLHFRCTPSDARFGSAGANIGEIARFFAFISFFYLMSAAKDHRHRVSTLDQIVNAIGKNPRCWWLRVCDEVVMVRKNLKRACCDDRNSTIKLFHHQLHLRQLFEGFYSLNGVLLIGLQQEVKCL